MGEAYDHLAAFNNKAAPPPLEFNLGYCPPRIALGAANLFTKGYDYTTEGRWMGGGFELDIVFC